MHWRQYLRSRTNDPPFLWKMVGGVLLFGVAVAYLFQGGLTASIDEMDARDQVTLNIANGLDAREPWERLLKDPQSFDVVLELIPELHRLRSTAGESQQTVRRPPINLKPYESILQSADLGRPRQQIAEYLWSTCETGELTSELVALALTDPPTRYANLALAEYWRKQREFAKSITFYEREGRLPEADTARKKLVSLLQAAQDHRTLQRLAEDPRYQDVIDLGVQIDLQVAKRNWWNVWWLIPLREMERISLGPALLAAFAGLWWLVFALHAGQVDSERGGRWWLCVLALPLGVLSIWLTDFFIYWQEAEWKITSSRELVAGLRYFVVGVGLREELSKLLLLLPLTPFLARRGQVLETLIVGACVGLGFAILENQLYFAQTRGMAAVGRFATANFFHMASTSLIGLAVVRAIRQPRERAGEAVAWFLLIVIAHGAYDAFIALPALMEYSIASSLILVLLAYQFFHELRYARAARQEAVSLTATFLLSVSMVASATLIYLSFQFGFVLALMALVPDLISIAVMVYVFLREMPNSLVTV